MRQKDTRTPEQIERRRAQLAAARARKKEIAAAKETGEIVPLKPRERRAQIAARPAQRVDPERWAIYFEELDRGQSRTAASEIAGISYPTILRLHQSPTTSSGLDQYKKWVASDRRDVTDPKFLCDEAKQALVDFEFFRKRYFGHISLPWHVKAAKIIVEALETTDKEFLVINCPPGSGKSTLLTHDIIMWALVRNRALRVMIGTGAATTGADYTNRIRNSFDRILPLDADDIEKSLGLAVDGESTLLADYGRFKPVDSGYWRGDKLVLARRGGQPAHQKEASVVSFGQKSGFLGGRYNLVVWDDVVTDANSRTASQQAELARWWRSTAESRLEPGGVLVLMGQRMGAHDLYRHVIDLKDISDHLDGDLDEDALPTRYTHIKFPAHDEEACKGGDSTHVDHGRDAKPWPRGCLLDPIRLPYKDLRVSKYNDPATYACVYQQEDSDPDSVLVNPLWIKGGYDAGTGIIHPGCWDLDRHLGTYPKNLAGDLFSVVSADPSPSQYWGAMLWLYQADTDMDHLIDIERKRMGAPDFLDWNHATQSYSGLLEDWWQQSNDAGHPVKFVIVETNAAQKFLLQYDHAKRWQMDRGVDLVSHDTKHQNKSNAEYGVTSLAPHYRHGKVRLPGHWASRKPVLSLYEEVTRYPNGATTDLVMAHWFLRFNAHRLFVPSSKLAPRFNRPTWVQSRSRGLRVV